MTSRLTAAQQLYVPSSWTDHNLLSVDILPDSMDIGPGSWRFNPSLLLDKNFLKLLDLTITIFFESTEETTQDAWESLKRVLQGTAKKYSQGSKARFRRKSAAIQQQRTDVLHSPNSLTCTSLNTDSLNLSTNARQIESILDLQIQQETRKIMLRSATRWHEQGERNNKYFYKVIKDRQSQQTIQSLRSSITNEVIISAQGIIREAQSFYRTLYTPDQIDQTAVRSLLNTIPTAVRLTEEQANDLIEEPNLATIEMMLSHAPIGKSPGLDGIPFEVYKYLHSSSMQFRKLLLQILKDALTGTFPSSWQHTRMVLLYKKGNSQLLANWRPLSLINTDAKLFTKMIANNLNEVLPTLINPYQTGFMPHRLISDNGWINQALMANLKDLDPLSPNVAALLDQEKAYDRVHPEYLRQVLLRFGFPQSLVSCLSDLFFSTQISVSINGWIGAPIP
ncbi:hypothetical protein G6F56_002028 [Rhizopus delemar]|nr:hypothetical protein G6F56_002028 [Rhizopus delemar]